MSTDAVCLEFSPPLQTPLILVRALRRAVPDRLDLLRKMRPSRVNLSPQWFPRKRTVKSARVPNEVSSRDCLYGHAVGGIFVNAVGVGFL